MSATITVSGKSLGTKKPLFADWSVDYPSDLPDGGGRITLRELISTIVRREVAEFTKRQEERRFIHVLTAREIANGAERGKIDMVGHDPAQDVDEEHSVAAALQAFEDGIYFVIVDEAQQRDLDREVFLRPDSTITFIRLTMLAGG